MRAWGVVSLFLAVVVLGACRFNGGDDPLVVSGDYPLIYIKRPAAAFRAVDDPLDFKTGADLYLRELPASDAAEVNLTADLTRGHGMVADPTVSYDGRYVAFSLRCGAGASQACSLDPTWSVWLYDMKEKTLRRVIEDLDVASDGHDLQPEFLPDGRLLFSSNRQHTSMTDLGYRYPDEARKDEALLLHVMDRDGGGLEQLTFNQSHDLEPVDDASGRVVFSRWERTAKRDRFTFFRANTDGSALNVLYGAHSPGDVFMSPAPLADGRMLAVVQARGVAWRGGALMLLDVQNFGDEDDGAPGASGKGQVAATPHNVALNSKVSSGGRFATPRAFGDGSGRALVSYSPPNLVEVEDPQSGTKVMEEQPPAYGLYVWRSSDHSLRPLLLPAEGVALTDAMLVAPRDLPSPRRRDLVRLPDILMPDENAPHGYGIINIKSVYDMDEQAWMGNRVLTNEENLRMSLPMIQTAGREVVDIALLKDPAQTRAEQRPARFLRIIEAVPPPLDLSPLLAGDVHHRMQRIVGYAPIEPDGSVRVVVPADKSLQLTVTDAEGRAFTSHDAWFQVRPAEELTCQGCHEPARTPPLNAPPIAGDHPNTSSLYFALAGETMAESRTRVDVNALLLNRDLIYTDVWTDEFTAGRQPDPDLRIEYPFPAPVDGVINYSEHIEPIWQRSRAQGACVSCHNGSRNVNNPEGLDLGAGESPVDGRSVSYRSLVESSVLTDENGRPVLEMVDGLPRPRRAAARVVSGKARESYLMEVISNQELFAPKSLQSQRLDHSVMLSAAEKRLIAEWIDIGAHYFNSPFDENGEIRRVKNNLSYRFYAGQVHSVISRACAKCHYAIARGEFINESLVPSNFTLFGIIEEDFLVVSSMVTDILDPDNSRLLSLPSSVQSGHPVDSNGEVFLKNPSKEYGTIRTWIRTATEPLP